MTYKNILENSKEEYKNILIDQCLDIFLIKGIDIISMNQLAKELGVGVASLYRYFKSKNNLVILTGIKLWQRIEFIFEGVFETETYRSLTGYQQLQQLMKVNIVLFEGHPSYLKFISEFDNVMLKNKVTPKQLSDYEKSIFSVGKEVYNAYQKGLKDQTVNEIENFDEFYRTCSLALQALSQKLLASKEILESDKKYNKNNEIQILIDLVLDRLRGKNNEESK